MKIPDDNPYLDPKYAHIFLAPRTQEELSNSMWLEDRQRKMLVKLTFEEQERERISWHKWVKACRKERAKYPEDFDFYGELPEDWKKEKPIL